MTTQHTPGPWVHNGLDNHFPRDDFSLAVAVYTADEARFICSTDTPKHLARMAVDATAADANARLIAAAPDLLAALKWVFEERLAPDSCEHDEESQAPDTCVVCAARAVIAKAEGD